MVISRSPYRLKPYPRQRCAPLRADFAGVREHGTSDNLVLEVEGECAILHDERQQVENVLGVELARVLSERGWDVERPQNDCRPDRYRFSRLRACTIAATLGAEIDDHGARFHRGDLIGLDQYRRTLARHRRRGDDHVGLGDMLRQDLPHLRLFLSSQFSRVSTFPRASTPVSTNFAPSERACSAVSGRTS
jgi:hypothetical protein